MDGMTLDELVAPFPELRRRTVESLREVVRAVVPDAIEAVRPGWGLIGYRVPVGRRTPYFGFIWPEPAHVHLGFEYGVFMDDPHRVLRGTDLKKVRFVTLTRPGEIPRPILEDLVREGIRVASMGRSERVGLLLDREMARGT